MGGQLTGDHLSVAFTDGRSHLGGRLPISGHLSIIIPGPVKALDRVSIVGVNLVLVDMSSYGKIHKGHCIALYKHKHWPITYLTFVNDNDDG